MKSNAPAILCLKVCRKLDLIGRVNAVELEFPEAIVKKCAVIFEGLRCIMDFKLTIIINNGGEGVILPCRKSSISLQAYSKAGLDRMDSSGVTARVDWPTEWMNCFVIAHKKDGTLRIC
ncbi:hypothetical protein QAD02_008360 [Eretmocerus hayati]|uniref:Uncharacterized protein n=1 Tax=Eretmocerus hayati TaxID=131215 RepID=A0ACC2N697_9HYME|nr:hypothetical protein QAD02_008360 [Eretmocerus hayati]